MSTTAAATASRCRRKRRQNSRHWLRGAVSPTGTAGPASPGACSAAISVRAPLAPAAPAARALERSSRPITTAPDPGPSRHPDPGIEGAVEDVGEEVEGDDEG